MNDTDLVNDLILELNLDESTQTTQVLSNLISFAKATVNQSVNSSINQDVYDADSLYKRSVLTLTTQLFYDRTLSAGMSLGLRMMIEQLKGVYENGLPSTGN